MNSFPEDTDPNWRVQGACTDLPTDDFFPEGQGKAVDAQVARAKAVCASCPVAEMCLEFSLRTNQPFGIFGGTTPSERRAIRKERRIVAA
ncbi:WhiB family transcriptional regulator [Georgenia sp. Z1344]|uniref:WhiB family transcriptional regulator n=1 Tax=Georgenia sp. Z1344 TaxID=3416706 RepID=UPI003CED77A4